ncbi:hypothetical protein Tco_0880053, partial [Tanacetum coccineum]
LEVNTARLKKLVLLAEVSTASRVSTDSRTKLEVNTAKLKKLVLLAEVSVASRVSTASRKDYLLRSMRHEVLRIHWGYSFGESCIKDLESLHLGVPKQEPVYGDEEADIQRAVMAAPTIPVFAEENLGDPINIRMDIIHPKPVVVVAFPAVAVVRTQAQHEKAIRGIQEHLLGVVDRNNA